MGVKELLLGYKKYCVKAADKRAGCLERCFPTKAEARAYMKKVCGCYIQTIKQRRPFEKRYQMEEEPPEGEVGED